MSPQQSAASVTHTFLLEIGSEEIPARFIPDARTELASRAAALLDEAHLPWRDIRTLATPRRLVLIIEGLGARQPDRERVIKGPPVRVAFDADGQPTAAATGFARKAGIELDACERDSDARGEFLVARTLETGAPAAEVLQQELPGLVLGIPYRKVMRWGDGDLEYPRPLQWLVALLDETVVPLCVGDLVADRRSRGHRTLVGDQPVTVPEAAAYEPTMLAAGVVADPDQRRKLIVEGLNERLTERAPEARLVPDEELLTEVVFLCEHPTPFIGEFGGDFSALPDRVITTALKAHQRYFSVASGKGGRLLPCFAAVRDGGTDHLQNVIAGNERVLRARLSDALFYWTFDQKKSPDEQVAQLASVTWLEGFGSVLDKTERLRTLTEWVWTSSFGDGEPLPATLGRAAQLCKSDLVSEMIKDGKEFTKLEGFIGARYAELAGEDPETCRVMERYYLPRTASGELPGDRASSALALAERLDTVAGCWQAGFVPTGARDPYALRRHVLSMIRILLDLQVNLDLAVALRKALAGFQDFASDQEPAQLEQDLDTFVQTRLAGYFVENLDCDPDVVRAVLPVRWSDPVDALRWVEALSRYRAQENFQLLATGFKRCRNILKDGILSTDALDACLERWAGGGGAEDADFSGFTEPAEIALRDGVIAVAAELIVLEKAGDYSGIFEKLSELGPAIDSYFDSVRVNAEDPDLKKTRTAFIREVHGLFARYADFREVVAGED